MTTTTTAAAEMLDALDGAMRRRGLVLGVQLLAGGRVRAQATRIGLQEHLVAEGHGDDLAAGLAALARDLDRQGA